MATTTRTTEAQQERSKSSGLLQRIPVTNIVYYLILIWFTLVLIGPTSWLMLAGFKPNPEILSSPYLLPQDPNLAGYDAAINDVGLPNFFVNSFIVSVGTMISVLVVATLAAYPIARFNFPLKSFFSLVFSLGIVVPVTSLIVPEILIIRTLGLFDTKHGLILLYTALYFPISFLILRAFFIGIPREIEEAAIMDGASYWTLLTRVILPISSPGLSTVAVVVFVFTWNEFLYALLLTSSTENRTVQVAIQFFRSQFDFNLQGMYAAVSLVMIVPIIVFILMQERVVSGLTAGATKT
jgi:raffinose/stachyose/melibiose transport system permease protein